MSINKKNNAKVIQIFAVRGKSRNGVIAKTINDVEIEESETYFEIFKTDKNTMIATIA